MTAAKKPTTEAEREKARLKKQRQRARQKLRAEALAKEIEVQAALTRAEASASVLAERMVALETIGPEELGRLIGRSGQMIRVDASRRPETLPPRFVVPGTRKLLWRLVDVREWMEALAELEQERRAAVLRASQRLADKVAVVKTAGRSTWTGPVQTQPPPLRVRGAAATQRMKEKREALK